MIIAIIHLFDVDAVFDFQYLVALSREFPCEAHFFFFSTSYEARIGSILGLQYWLGSIQILQQWIVMITF